MAKTSALKKKEEGFTREVLIGDLRDLEGTTKENVNASFGECCHGIPDDNDCLECRTNSCMGGADCECAARSLR